MTVNFLVRLPTLRILTPDNVSLIKPLANKTDSSTVVPSSKISRAPTLTTAYSLRLTFLKPLFGKRLNNGNCPPSNPGLTPPPLLAFCPLCPRPAVLPLPEPTP